MDKLLSADGTGIVFAEERRQQIITILKNNKKIIVPELCTHFGVSASTIRNDLRELEEAKLIKRTHGGAIAISKVNLEPTPAAKETIMHPQKEAIANLAATLVDDGDTIAISTGTTSFEFAKKILDKKKLTVVLNDIHIASFLESNSNFTLFVLGGIIRRGFHYLNATGMSIPHISIDKIFFSCNGLSISNGATVPDFYLANNVKNLIELASEAILLCDSSKLGSISFAQIVPYEKINKVVIDDDANPNDIKLLREKESNEILIAPVSR